MFDLTANQTRPLFSRPDHPRKIALTPLDARDDDISARISVVDIYKIIVNSPIDLGMNS